MGGEERGRGGECEQDHRYTQEIHILYSLIHSQDYIFLIFSQMSTAICENKNLKFLLNFHFHKILVLRIKEPLIQYTAGSYCREHVTLLIQSIHKSI